MSEPAINGFCDDKFQPVADAFAKNFFRPVQESGSGLADNHAHVRLIKTYSGHEAQVRIYDIPGCMQRTFLSPF